MKSPALAILLVATLAMIATGSSARACYAYSAGGGLVDDVEWPSQ